MVISLTDYIKRFSSRGLNPINLQSFAIHVLKALIILKSLNIFQIDLSPCNIWIKDMNETNGFTIKVYIS